MVKIEGGVCQIHARAVGHFVEVLSNIWQVDMYVEISLGERLLSGEDRVEKIARVILLRVMNLFKRYCIRGAFAKIC